MRTISREGSALVLKTKAGNPQRLHARPLRKRGEDIVRSAWRHAGVLSYVHIHMNTKENRELKKDLKISERQRELVVGLLLGDGHFETQNGGRTYRLKVEHGSAQKDYLIWLAREFQEWIPSGWYEKQRGKKLVYGFTTVSHESFRFYGAQFYQNSRKRIPPLIKKLISPLALAIWFLDDGSKKSSQHKSLVIHSLGYTKKDLVLAQESLKTRFNIESALHKQRNESFRLYFPYESARIIAQFVEPILQEVPLFAYKLENIKPKK